MSPPIIMLSVSSQCFRLYYNHFIYIKTFNVIKPSRSIHYYCLHFMYREIEAWGDHVNAPM